MHAQLHRRGPIGQQLNLVVKCLHCQQLLESYNDTVSSQYSYTGVDFSYVMADCMSVDYAACNWGRGTWPHRHQPHSQASPRAGAVNSLRQVDAFPAGHTPITTVHERLFTLFFRLHGVMVSCVRAGKQNYQACLRKCLCHFLAR